MPTHGSLAKAGKVASKHASMRQWREVRKSDGRVRKFKGKKKLSPKQRNRRNYYLRVILGRMTYGERTW